MEMNKTTGEGKANVDVANAELKRLERNATYGHADLQVSIVDVHDPKSLRGSKIAEELAGVARDGFGTNITDDDANNHILNVDLLQLIYVQGRLVGFASYDIFEFSGMKVLYLSGVVIRKDNQTKGLSKMSLGNAIGTIQPDVLTMRTQNPVVYHLASEFAKEIYPSDGLRGPSYELCVSIGEYVAVKRLGMRNYQKELFFEKGTYGTALNDKVPDVVDERARSVFEGLKLDRQRGDSIIIVAMLR